MALVFVMNLSACASVPKEVPPQLHGYWQFKPDNQSGLFGMQVGPNYVEINNHMMTVDSINQSENEYTILYLSNKKGEHLYFKIKQQANDSALFYTPDGKQPWRCKHFDRNPNIDYLPVSDYSKVIVGKWFDNNSRKTLAIEKGKLLYDDKRWDINWLGASMKQEYHALIENKGEYRLIILVKQANNSWNLTFDNNSTAFLPMSDDVDKYAVFGNWYEPSKNEWTYGFFEQFAIYDGKFWTYKELTIKKNKGTATLQNGDETLQLTLTKTDDSTLLIVSGKQNAITYKLAGRTLPHYKTADATRFADNHFARVDTAYITGYIRNRKSAKPFEISLHGMFTDEDVSYYGDVDSIGRFQMKVPLYNSLMVSLVSLQMYQTDVLEPNEHYFLFYDENTKQTLYMGKNARIHNELAAFDFSGIRGYSIPAGIKPLDFLAMRQQQYKIAKEYTNDIMKQMPNPSEKLRYFLANYAKYNIAQDLMQFQYKSYRNTTEKLPDEYMDYVRDTMLANPVAPITLNSDFFIFMRDFMWYFKNQKVSLSLSADEVINAVTSDKIIHDYYLASELYKTLDNERKPLENELFNKMISRIKTPLFRDKILATQKFYTELPGKSLEYTESLKNTDHLKEAKDADALWKELISPYKGKIIYADFWGTWCGPCKMQMKYVADIKKQFIGKDVIFMYFANNSPEEGWKNVIKSYSLTGENIVQYRLPDQQQSMLERRFGVNSYPTYLLIDRDGNVVDTNPPRPSQQEQTVDYLNSWLLK
ncbi:MAG: TlpA disulfide reductase family protein [Bacteroidales bacterium]|nr:TlpA disulfide reductase family protein [Bacteroidales bacterium]